MKYCNKCQDEKPKAEFFKKTSAKDGLQANCKSCAANIKRACYASNPEPSAVRCRAWRQLNKEMVAAYMREYRKDNSEKIAENKRKYRAENSEQIAERHRAYREANPEKIAEINRAYREANKEKCEEYMREWRKTNPEKMAAAFRAYREANIEQISSRHRAYRLANPEKIAAYGRNRRAKKREAEGSHTAADVKAIFESQRGLCANCEKKLFKSGAKKFHVDHIQPLSRGGSNDKYNLQCLCPACNTRKRAKDPLDWAKEIGKLL